MSVCVRARFKLYPNRKCQQIVAQKRAHVDISAGKRTRSAHALARSRYGTIHDRWRWCEIVYKNMCFFGGILDDIETLLLDCVVYVTANVTTICCSIESTTATASSVEAVPKVVTMTTMMVMSKCMISKSSVDELT